MHFGYLSLFFSMTPNLLMWTGGLKSPTLNGLNSLCCSVSLLMLSSITSACNAAEGMLWFTLWCALDQLKPILKPSVQLFVGPSLSRPHTSTTALWECVCMGSCRWGRWLLLGSLASSLPRDAAWLIGTNNWQHDCLALIIGSMTNWC